MHMNPYSAGASRNWSQWGVIALSVCALLVLTHCDSGFVPDLGPPPNSSDARTEKIKAWYDTALEEEQNAHLDPQRVGKLAGDSTLLSDSTIAAVLAAMVNKHPPDWDQMETWDNGSGGYIGATLLAGGLGTTSDPDLLVVRTLVADVDENGMVLSGYLLEFVSPDVQESQFKEYVEQWLISDFGNKPMLVAEYTVGYASTSAVLYAPDKDPIPVAMELAEKLGLGKMGQARRWYCWMSDFTRGGDVCYPTIFGEKCDYTPGNIEFTCVCVSGCDGTGDSGDGDGGDDGDGCPTGGCDTGGDSGDDDDDDDSDDDDSDDEDKEITFSFSCDQSVTRGNTAGCEVKVGYAEGVEEKQHTFNWSSSTGATFSMSDANGGEWRGKATEGVTITVAVAAVDFSAAATISVDPRDDYHAPSMSAEPTYSSKPRDSLGVLGWYTPFPDGILYKPEYGPQPEEGTGPWTGSFMAGAIAGFFASELLVSDDYDEPGPTYADADSTCSSAPGNLSDTEESYYSVNSHCGTLTGFRAMYSAIVAHEKEHEAGFNSCLTNTDAFTDLEAVFGSESDVTNGIKTHWRTFVAKFFYSGQYASEYKVTDKYWWRSGDTWVLDKDSVLAHGAGENGCNND